MSGELSSGYYQATPADAEWALEFGDLSQRQNIVYQGRTGLEQGVHPAVMLARMTLAADVGVARSVLSHLSPDFDFNCLNDLIPGRTVRIDYKPPQTAIVYKAENSEMQLLADVRRYLQIDFTQPVQDFVENEASTAVRESPFAEKLARTNTNRTKVISQIGVPFNSVRKHLDLFYASPFYGGSSGDLGSEITLMHVYDGELQPCTAVRLGGVSSNKYEQTAAFNAIRFAHVNGMVGNMVETSELAGPTVGGTIPSHLQGILSGPEPEDPSGLEIVALNERGKSYDDSITQRSVIGFSLRNLANLCGFSLEEQEGGDIVEYAATKGWGSSARVFLPIEEISPMQREHLANIGYLTQWAWLKPEMQKALGVIAN